MTKETFAWFLLMRISKKKQNTAVWHYINWVYSCRVGGLLGQIILHIDKALSRRLKCDQVDRHKGNSCTWVRVLVGGGGLFCHLERGKGQVGKERKRKETEAGGSQPPPNSIGVDKSLRSSDGARVLPQLTSPRTDRKVWAEPVT